MLAEAGTGTPTQPFIRSQQSQMEDLCVFFFDILFFIKRGPEVCFSIKIWP